MKMLHENNRRSFTELEKFQIKISLLIVFCFVVFFISIPIIPIVFVWETFIAQLFIRVKGFIATCFQVNRPTDDVPPKNFRSSTEGNHDRPTDPQPEKSEPESYLIFLCH